MVDKLIPQNAPHPSASGVEDWIEKLFTEELPVTKIMGANNTQYQLPESRSSRELTDFIDGSVAGKIFKPEKNLIPTSSDAESIAIVENGHYEKKFSKRVRKQDLWKRNVMKRKLNTGKPTEKRDGPVKRGRVLKVGCQGLCKLKCRIPQTLRSEIFSSFWNLSDITRQRDFINRHMDVVKPKYRRSIPGSTRSLNYSYYLNVKDEKTRICKKIFMETLDIANTTIKTVTKKMKGGFVEEDRRGKHGKQSKLEPNIRDGIRAHIESILKVESHYSRTDSTNDYIDGSLNFSKLYRMYVEKCRSEKNAIGKEHVYRTVFNTEYNIRLHKPKEDQCSM